MPLTYKVFLIFFFQIIMILFLSTFRQNFLRYEPNDNIISLIDNSAPRVACNSIHLINSTWNYLQRFSKMFFFHIAWNRVFIASFFASLSFRISFVLKKKLFSSKCVDLFSLLCAMCADLVIFAPNNYSK